MACVPCVAFVVAGGGLFWLGLHLWKRYRLVADTPLSQVREAPKGLVRLRGRATGEDRLVSPLTGVPCFYYSVDVRRSARSSQTSPVAGEDEARPFYLDDGTGRVRVDPKGAQLQVPQTFRATVTPGAVRDRFVEASLGVPGPSDEELRAYVPRYFARLREKMGAAATAAPAAFRDAAGKALAAAEWLEMKGVEVDTRGGGLTVGAGPYLWRFTERCLLADQECTVFGTLGENPSPRDDRDRRLVSQGVEGGTFLIDSAGEGLGNDLRNKALIVLLAGPAAVVIGLYFLFH